MCLLHSTHRKLSLFPRFRLSVCPIQPSPPPLIQPPPLQVLVRFGPAVREVHDDHMNFALGSEGQHRPAVAREESQRIEQAASESVGQAEAQVAITLDSLRSAPSPELLDRLEAEIEEERDAHRTVVRALRVQLTAADSTTVLSGGRGTQMR